MTTHPASVLISLSVFQNTFLKREDWAKLRVEGGGECCIAFHTHSYNDNKRFLSLPNQNRNPSLRQQCPIPELAHFSSPLCIFTTSTISQAPITSQGKQVQCAGIEL